MKRVNMPGSNTWVHKCYIFILTKPLVVDILSVVRVHGEI